MAASRALVLLLAMATVLGTAQGASYTVGAPAGSWGIGTNYTRWASGVTFRAGDQLVFKYARGAHDVVEVTKAGYDACSASSALATFATGDDAVALPAGGVTRYFICGVAGHCAAGMKLAVTVVGAAAAAPSPAPVALAPRGARPPTTTKAPSPAPVAMAPRAARSPATGAQPSPAPVAMAPRDGRPSMATPGSRAPATGGLPAVPPSSSAAAEAGVGGFVARLGLGAAVAAALMALY